MKRSNDEEDKLEAGVLWLIFFFFISIIANAVLVAKYARAEHNYIKVNEKAD